MIRDQRQMHGRPTVEAQREFWVQCLAEKGITPTDDTRVLTAYISESRWVANCENCNGGIACWDENPHGCCLDCGHVYVIKFPKDYKIAEALLLQRPLQYRHWQAHRGEKVAHLESENRHYLRGDA